MKKYEENKKVSTVQESDETFMKTFSSQEEAELYRLKRDMNRSDMDKLLLFTNMLRRNVMFNKAKIITNNTGK
jgi:hypothetical protein